MTDVIELPDGIRIPLHSLQADLGYLLERHKDPDDEVTVHDRIAELLGQIEIAALTLVNTRASTPAAGWRPISEAPKDGTHLLLGRFVTACPFDMNGYMAVDFWHTKHFTGWGLFNEQWPPTHYMPPPAPPASEE